MTINNHPNAYSTEEMDEIRSRIMAFYNDEDTDYHNCMDENDLMKSGCQVTALIMRDAKDNGHSQQIIDGYLKCPPFLFYTSSNNTIYRPILRIYGIGQIDETTIVAHAVSAMVGMNNDIVGGIELNNCIPVKSWSNSQMTFLNSGLVVAPHAFTEVFGFTRFAR
jgi:hypothetical protein